MRARLFVAAFVVQALVLIGWAAGLELQLARADRIRLEVVQRDPRDLLRGDYVVLQYAIDQISVDIIAGGRPEYGERLWVLLEPKDGLHVVVAASRAPVTPSPEQRLIVGEVRSFVAVAAGGARTSGVHVDYGIQRYYVPEGRGILPRGKVEAEVALPSSGRALLTRLFVDGRPYP